MMKMIENPECNTLDSQNATKEYETLDKGHQVFVFCAGKCGSTTIEVMFRRLGFRTIKIHNLYNWSCFTDLDFFEYLQCSLETYGKILIIDSFRTPIERKISSFFQNLDEHLSLSESKSFGNRKNVHELIDIFNDHYLINLENYQSMNEIFARFPNRKRMFTTPCDCTFLKNCSISYYENEKNKDVDSSDVIRSDISLKNKKQNIYFVQVRFQDISQWPDYFERTIFHIFGYTVRFPTVSANTTKEKPCNTTYKAFLKLYKCPEKHREHIVSILLAACDSNLMDVHEIESYLEQWT